MYACMYVREHACMEWEGLGWAGLGWDGTGRDGMGWMDGWINKYISI